MPRSCTVGGSNGPKLAKSKFWPETTRRSSGLTSQVELRAPARVRDVQQAAIGERRESAAQRYSRRRFEPPRSQDLFLDVDAVRNAAPHSIGEPARRRDRRAPIDVRCVDAQRVRGGRAVDDDAHVGDANRSAGAVRAFDRQRDACSGREPELTVRVETPQRCTGERQVAQADAPAPVRLLPRAAEREIGASVLRRRPERAGRAARARRRR